MISPPAWLTPAIVARMGKDTDAAIARDVDRTVASVTAQRKRLGIAAESRDARYEPPAWLTPAIVARMGKDTDAAIARDVDRTSGAVLFQRQRLGIASENRLADRVKVLKVCPDCGGPKPSIKRRCDGCREKAAAAARLRSRAATRAYFASHPEKRKPPLEMRRLYESRRDPAKRKASTKRAKIKKELTDPGYAARLAAAARVRRPDAASQAQRRYRLRHPGSAAASAAKWREANLEKAREMESAARKRRKHRKFTACIAQLSAVTPEHLPKNEK